MKAETKGFVLLATALVIMLGTAGGVEHLPPNAGYLEWVGIGLSLVVAFISGILGYSYINER